MSIPLAEAIKPHICFYASFDQGIDADISRGDGQAIYQTSVVKHDPNAGRFGGGLVFSAAEYGWSEDECMFSARDNFPYRPSAFSGAISLWLNGIIDDMLILDTALNADQIQALYCQSGPVSDLL